jgi:glycosyltransferase involved in cell wall biosynthesis
MSGQRRESKRALPANEGKRIVMFLAKSYATDPRVKNEAETLVQTGHEVIVLSWDRSGKQPSESMVNGVRIVSRKLLQGSDFSKASFAFSALILQVFCVTWCLRRMRGKYVVHSHDFNTLMAGVVLRRMLGPRVKLVYDCHELTPSAYAEWYGPRLGLVAGGLERTMIGWADCVITVSPPIQAYLSRLTSNPIVVIYNTIPIDQVPQGSRNSWKSRLGLDGFIVSYVGSLRLDVGLDELIDAASLFLAAGEHRIRFVIVGDGPDLNRISRKAERLEGIVTLVPRVSHAKALEFVTASDVSYAIYRTRGEGSAETSRKMLSEGNTLVAMPWKVFEAMACGTCVLVRGGTYIWDFVSQLEFGISGGSGSPKEIFDSLTLALSQRERLEFMGSRARMHFLKNYNWNNMADRLLSIYASLGA